MPREGTHLPLDTTLPPGVGVMGVIMAVGVVTSMVMWSNDRKDDSSFGS